MVGRSSNPAVAKSKRSAVRTLMFRTQTWTLLALLGSSAIPLFRLQEGSSGQHKFHAVDWSKIVVPISYVDFDSTVNDLKNATTLVGAATVWVWVLFSG